MYVLVIVPNHSLVSFRLTVHINVFRLQGWKIVYLNVQPKCLVDVNKLVEIDAFYIVLVLMPG